MPQKKQTQLETTINEIVIVNNKKLVPYIELVNFSSRNIDQKKLGTILGIFEIKDTSEDSAYIVNFLSSVAKKTYFASHQKNPEESFETTLAKVNLSLSEVAKHGNINWIGKIDAVLCSVFENQINFSVSGDAKVLLLRNGKLSEISAGLSPIDEAANPLKTFTDIASGKLDDGDKLILTTDDISHIFTLDDLEKYALSFNNNKFLRFLKTALINELDIAGTMVIDAKKVTRKVKEKTLKKNEQAQASDFNLFGSSAFEKNKKANSIKELPSDKNRQDYTHEKTGHIYITDSQENYENFTENKFEQLIALSKEKFFDFWDWTKEKLFRKLTYKLKKQTASFFKRKTSSDNIFDKPRVEKKSFVFPDLNSKTKKMFGTAQQKIATLGSSGIHKVKSSFKKDYAPPIQNNSKKERAYGLKISANRDLLHDLSKRIAENIFKFTRFVYLKIRLTLALAKKALPHFLKLKTTFSRMSLKLKLITLAIIILILTLPILFLNNKDASTPSASEQLSANSDIEINPSAQSHKEASLLYQSPDLIGSFVFNNTVFAISKNKIIKLGEKNEDYSFPENFKNALHYSFMNDLNLLFLVNGQNQLISFSPISLKFKDDVISIASDASIAGIGTYLTYLYVVESKNKQIYRYPRADDGFGEKINWLNSDISFDDISGVAIDGNVYLAKKDIVLKLFNRKTRDFNLKKDENSSINGIFTNEDITNIYILDNLNGELIKFDKDGNKINTASNNNLSKAVKIWVDEKENLGYFVSENSLFKIALP
ncbi:MAG: hypothetical protein ACD_7C00270G0004 [uncultured bacterium]|nr:MAG: hypothetical protein ACD_7C00270G0004 [uncultured bacterium]HBR79905.1 hypothetical protein [Candidatus Moranbacteria bacterium]